MVIPLVTCLTLRGDDASSVASIAAGISTARLWALDEARACYARECMHAVHRDHQLRPSCIGYVDFEARRWPSHGVDELDG